MARKRAPLRLDQILEAATQLFISRGYREARVDMVAEACGISSATVYLYATTKEALFALVLRRLFGHDIDALPSPYQLKAGASLANLAVEYLREVDSTPILDGAIAARKRKRSSDEFRNVVGELYRLVFRNRRAITLVEKCGREWPELEMVFRHELRAKLLGKLTTYLKRDPVLFQMPDADIAARAILELVAWFAMHRFSASNTSLIDDRLAEETVTTMLVRAFTRTNDNDAKAKSRAGLRAGRRARND